jgi:UDP-N-acetylmuramyl tripeptide synthase
MILSLIMAKIVAKILHILGRGATTLPGKIALKIKPNILLKLSRDVFIICVTGTNGKTTTCAMLEHAFKSNNMSYFLNKSGANMITGITTSFIMNSNIFGKCKKEYAIIECDENSLPLVSQYINADILVVTNIFRDQLDRYGEVNYTLSKIKLGIANMPNVRLVLNADCPMTYSLRNKNTYTFGINANLNNGIVSDNRFCPVCNNELVYHSIVYAQLGNFHCPVCDYARQSPDLSVDDILDASTFILRGNVVHLQLQGVYNIYNFLACACVLKNIGINDFSPLYEFGGAFGRMEHFKNGEQNILLLLVKNPVGLANCIKFVSQKKNDFDMAFALNDNDADGTDVSWIWDADFKPLAIKNSFIYTLGKRSYDMALRLKYDGLNISEKIDKEDYGRLIEIIKSTNRDFVVFSTYTAMMNMRHSFVDEFGGKEFWK